MSDPELYAIIVEGAEQDPILMEAEGRGMSRENAREHMKRIVDGRRYFRGCVVRLEYVDGNRAVMHAAAAVRDGPPMPSSWQRDSERRELEALREKVRRYEAEGAAAKAPRRDSNPF